MPYRAVERGNLAKLYYKQRKNNGINEIKHLPKCPRHRSSQRGHGANFWHILSFCAL